MMNSKDIGLKFGFGGQLLTSVLLSAAITLLLPVVDAFAQGGPPGGPPGGGGVGGSAVMGGDPNYGRGATISGGWPWGSQGGINFDPWCHEPPDLELGIPQFDSPAAGCCFTCAGGKNSYGSRPSLSNSCGGSPGSPCTSGACPAPGLGGGSHTLGPDYSASDVGRIWIPNNRFNNSSFSPGYFSHFDSQIHVYPDVGSSQITFFDVFAKQMYLFVDGLNGDTFDGVYHDQRNEHARKIELLNSSGTVVSDVSLASTVKVTHWNGVSETFELFDLDSSPTAETWAARLTKRTDGIGRDLTISYKTWTPTEITAAPDRQWQINTVSDVAGNTLTFTYDSQQRSGRWCVTKVLRNDGIDVDFQYNTDALTSVTFPDGTKSTYAYGQDLATQTATVTAYEAIGTGREFVYYLTNDITTIQDEVINQPVGVYRMVKDNNSVTRWMMIPNSDPLLDSKFIYGGGNFAYVQYGDGTHQMYDSWSETTGGGGPGAQPEEFPGVDGTLDSQVVGADSATTTAQLQTGQWPGETDQAGREKTYLYDSDGNRTKVTYTADSTYEEYAYNSLGQVTRARSREGEVTLYTYDAQGKLTSQETGLEEQSGVDVQTASYAKSTKEYYGSGHANEGLLKADLDPLYSATNPTLHRTDYEYDSNDRMTKMIGPADTVGGSRPTTTYTYNTAGQLASVTDPKSHVVLYTYDDVGRQITATYSDTSTEQTLYGAVSSGNEGRVIKTKDRVDTVTYYVYDTEGRLQKTTVGAAIDADILDGSADDTVVTDVNQQQITEYTYLAGSDTLKSSVKQNGAKTDYVYDAKNRLTEIKQYPRVGKTLTSKKAYLDNQLLYDEDPYGRRKYYGYRASDGMLIRTVTCTVSSYTLADFTAVWNLTRDSSANASYIIHDAIRDDDGRLTKIVDGRNVEIRFEYDAQGRETKKTEAFGTTVAAVTETDYDDAGNVTEVRSPRYFDSSDTEGYQNAKQTWTYSGRNLVLTHTEAAGSTIAATESFTYDLNGNRITHTDFRSKVWTTIYDSCCAKSLAFKNPLGDGSIRNTDPAGRVAHTATVSDVDSHTSNLGSPLDAKTLAESTTRYDAVGRVLASTSWLVAQGTVDPEAPPIAGLDGVSAANGLTTQYLYDNNLSDGVGLDSTGGVSYTKMAGTGTSSVSLSSALTKLAATQVNGGAGTSFDSGSPGAATVVINAEDEVSFTIIDAAGRTVMSGQLDNYNGMANALLTWSSHLHDTITNVSGFGDCLETRSIDALGKATKSLTDGAGRTIQVIDQLAKVTSFTYDSAGNQLSVRDPNNVGEDVVYDELGRPGLTTDTTSDTTNSTYDKAGNRLTATDGKSQSTSYVYDARGRQKSQTDRLSGTTSFTYLDTGQLASLKDAENQTTSYTYDDAGKKLTETYPDHSGGTPGSSTYGIVTFTNDDAGRVLRKQDQSGDTVTHTYDLAGRMTQRDYRTAANSPSGTIADSDTFTYDAASRLLTAVSGRYSNTVTHTYDTAGRKKTEALTISGQTYTITSGYNNRGELTSLTYPDSTAVTRSYTDRGQLYQLTHAGTTIDTRTYDNGGRLTGSSYNNGISESRTYNADSTLATLSHTGASIGNLTYGWDDNKNKTGETITGTMSGYGFTIPTGGYDAEDRLVTYNRTDTNLDQSWNLSLVGDWNSITTEGVAQTRTHGPSHELLTGGGGTVNTDVKGNITLIPAALRSSASALGLNWDMDNRLSTADVGNDSSVDVTYQFDALGRRVYRHDGTTAMVYVQSGQQTIADYVAGTAATSPTYRYVYASYIDEPVLRYKPVGTESLYYHRNQQYSITALTNASGTIVERYAYSAYGVPTIADATGTVLTSSAYDNRYTYTGREWDEDLELYHYRARMYDPELGRFCGRDPIGYVDGTNRYHYVGNTPFIANDPDGLVRVLFDFVAKSFIKGVNPIGRIVPDRAGIVPTPGIGITPINQPTATQRLRALASIVQHLTAFNEDPGTAAKDGKYRLYTRVDMTLDCTCDNIPFIDRIETDMDGGVESEWWMSWPVILAPKVKGTINLSPLNITYPFPWLLQVDWRGWGRPNALVEPGMQAVAWRTSKNIWHWPETAFICINGTPTLLYADLIGSKFPSHRLWLNNRLIDFVPQNTFADLWYPLAAAPSFVH